MHLAHAHLGRRAASHLGAQRGGELLRAEADAEHGQPCRHGLVHQRALVTQPGEVVGDAHGSAQDDEPGHVRGRSGRGDGFAQVHAHDAETGARIGDGPRHRPGTLECHVLQHHPFSAGAHRRLRGCG